MIAVGAYIASSLIAGIFSGDDRKPYAYFTVSTPQGVKGSLYYKYILALAMNGLFMLSSNDWFEMNKYPVLHRVFGADAA